MTKQNKIIFWLCIPVGIVIALYILISRTPTTALIPTPVIIPTVKPLIVPCDPNCGGKG